MGRLVVFSSKRLLTAIAAAGLLLGAGVERASAQAAQATGPQWKDRAEYDLYVSITKETDPVKRAALLDQWKQKYPTSDYKGQRETLLVTTYAQAGKPQDALNAAKEALASDPSNVTALYWATIETPLAPVTPDNLDFGQKCAQGLLDAKKPAAMSDADWDKTKRDMAFDGTAHTTLGWVAMQKKDNETAEKEFTASLAANPNAGQVSYWRGTATLAEKKPEKQGAALYDFARAAAYDGPGALNPTGRDQVKAYVAKAYATYHGSNDGFDKLLATAKTSANPPADFKIVSQVDIEKAKIEEENKERAANPSLALWKSIKDQLTAAGGQGYFDGSVKDAALPGGAGGVEKFTGKLVSMEPATRPKKLVLAITDSTTPEVTLSLDAPLPGKADPGTTISFSGVAKEFTATPFNVTFAVEKKNIDGWPVKAEPPVRHPVQRKTAHH